MEDVQRWAGLYRVLDDGADVGTEAWTREVGSDQIRLTSVVNRTDEDEYEEEIEIILEPDWRPLQMTIDRATADGDRRYVGRRVGSAWISQIVRESGPMRTATQPFDSDTHLDYLTAHTNSVTMHRLALGQETGQEIAVVYIDPDTWTPSLVRQKYARLADPEPFEVAGLQVARAYEYLGASGMEYTIWTDENDIILRYEDLFEIVELHNIQ
ncbi:MAG: putative glycolipid-binding domain-containing protein [Thermomicrobiaceae bacterium]